MESCAGIWEYVCNSVLQVLQSGGISETTIEEFTKSLRTQVELIDRSITGWDMFSGILNQTYKMNTSCEI